MYRILNVIWHRCKVLEKLENALENAWKVLQFKFDKGVGTLTNTHCAYTHALCLLLQMEWGLFLTFPNKHTYKQPLTHSVVHLWHTVTTCFLGEFQPIKLDGRFNSLTRRKADPYLPHQYCFIDCRRILSHPGLKTLFYNMIQACVWRVQKGDCFVKVVLGFNERGEWGIGPCWKCRGRTRCCRFIPLAPEQRLFIWEECSSGSRPVSFLDYMCDHMWVCRCVCVCVRCGPTH